jgi:Mrp family chromosome partitioning ATPase
MSSVRHTEWQNILKINFLRLLAHYPVGSIKTILFTGCSPGVGVTTVAANFAAMISRDAEEGVLLIDANFTAPKITQFFVNDPVNGREHVSSDSNMLAIGLGTPVKADSCNVYVLPLSLEHLDPIAILESNGFIQYLELMRRRFNYVIIDAPSVHEYAESLVLASKVDGIIVVIQSGKTRRHVATETKKKLEDAGGRVLGVILNRSKRYIPEFIYKRL